MSAATSTPAPSATAPASPPPCSPSICRSGIELLSDMMLRPHFDADDLAREKEVVLQELGEARDTPSRHHLRRSLDGGLPGPAARPLDPRRRGQHRRRSRVDDLHDWRTRSLSRRQPRSWSPPARSTMTTLVALAEARFGGLPDGRDRAGRAGPLRRRRPRRAGRAPIRRISPPPMPRRRSTIRIFMRRGCSATSSAPAPRRGCSRRCARSAASLIRSGRRSQPYRDTGLFYFYAATARREAAAAAALIAEVVAEAAETATQRELDRAQGAGQGRPARCRSNRSWGQAGLCRARARPSLGRLVEPAELVARARGGDARRRSARPARRCSRAGARRRQRARSAACRRAVRGPRDRSHA